MALCAISSGISLTCDDKRYIGGNASGLWIGNIDDLATAIDTSSTSAISSLSFNQYKGLYRFDLLSDSIDAGFSPIVNPGAGKAFNHTVSIKFPVKSQAIANIVNDLLVADIFCVVQDNNKTFKIYGGTDGLEVSEGSQASGFTATDDASLTYTFTGPDLYIPIQFLDTDFATTKATLEGYEV